MILLDAILKGMISCRCIFLSVLMAIADHCNFDNGNNDK